MTGIMLKWRGVAVTTKRVHFHFQSSQAYGFTKDIKETMNYTSSLMHITTHDLMKELYDIRIFSNKHGVILSYM